MDFTDRAALLEWIKQDSSLSLLLQEVVARQERELNPGQAGDPGHDLAHFLRVALWTLRLGKERVDPRHAVAAALLHDLINLPKNSPERHLASTYSAEEARKILPALGFGPEAVEQIAIAVRDHSFSRGAVPESELGKALQDADRLESLGSLGIMRTVSTGVRMGAGYFHPEDLWARHRALDDKAFSVDHFFVKLFRLPSLMNTEEGRKEALKRARIMEEFLTALGEELGELRPSV